MTRRQLIPVLCSLACFFTAAAPPARAALKDQIGFTQNLGQRLPLDLTFADADGRAVTLGSVFHGRPAVLVFGYFECPRLCGVTSDSIVDTLRDLVATIGRDYEFIYVSIDPDEKPPLATTERNTAVRRYGRGSDKSGWHYLTGDARAIAALTRAAGFRYRRDPATHGFAHATGFLVLTPAGTISRYFLGIEYQPAAIAAAVRAAAAGDTGSRIVDFLIACCRGGDFGAARWPWHVMQAGVGGSVLLLGFGLYRLVRRPRHQKSDTPPAR